MDDAADHAPVIDARLAAHIARQMRLNPLPFAITQPVKVLAHLSASESKHKRISNKFSRQQNYWVLTLALYGDKFTIRKLVEIWISFGR